MYISGYYIYISVYYIYIHINASSEAPPLCAQHYTGFDTVTHVSLAKTCNFMHHASQIWCVNVCAASVAGLVEQLHKVQFYKSLSRGTLKTTRLLEPFPYQPNCNMVGHSEHDPSCPRCKRRHTRSTHRKQSVSRGA